MCPFKLFGESGQKTGSSNGTCFPTTNIGHIRKWTIDLALIFFPEGQLPGTVSGSFAGIENISGQGIVVTQQA